MDAWIRAFTGVAPYLTHPLELVGFVLLLFFGIHRALIKSGIIPPVGPRVGGRLVQSLLRYSVPASRRSGLSTRYGGDTSGLSARNATRP
jgi:hypothetical protein